MILRMRKMSFVCAGMEKERVDVMKGDGSVLTTRDVFPNFMFVMAKYTAEMDQMRNLKCVHCGNVQKADGHVQTTSASVTPMFVINIMTAAMDQMNYMSYAENGNVCQDIGNATMENVLEKERFVMDISHVQMVLMKQMKCVLTGNALTTSGNVILLNALKPHGCAT